MRREDLVLNFICAVLALVSLASAVWVVISGRLGTDGLDALFLLMVALLAALLFAWMPVQSLRGGALRNLLTRRKAKSEQTAQQQAAAAGQQAQEEGRS